MVSSPLSYLFTLHQSVAQNLSDMKRSTFEMARRSFAPFQKSRQNHRSCLWTEALSGMISVQAQKYTVNLNLAYL